MLLGLDLGTTNIKATVLNDSGALVAEGAAAVDRFHTADGGAEQDIEQIWDAACQALRQATAEIDTAAIRGIGVSAQGGAIQLLDADDQPLGRVISWMDQRGRPYGEQFTRKLGEQFLASRIGHGVCNCMTAQFFRLREEKPRSLAKPNRVGFVGDMIVGRLCGRRAHEATSLAIVLPYNLRLGRPDPEILEHLGLAEDQLPDLVPAVESAGRLGDAAARETSLPPGLPVGPAIHDQYASALGAGSVALGDVCVGTGTAWVLLANTNIAPKPCMPQASVAPHPVGGMLGQMLLPNTGGSAIEWAMGLLGKQEFTGEQVDCLAESVPSGCDGLVVRPVFSSPEGARITGIRLSHGAGHLVRATIEGLACEVQRHLRMLTDAGVSVKRIILTGSAAASRITPKIIADVTSKPLVCATYPSVAARGAAIAAWAMVEGTGNLADLAHGLAAASRRVEPGPDTALYRRLFEDYVKGGQFACP